MSASRVRAQLRKSRQDFNKTCLTAANKTKNPIAIRAYILHGGRRGSGSGGAFAVFAERFPVSPPEAVTKVRGLHRYAVEMIAAAKAKLLRRKQNKLARKQRARA